MAITALVDRYGSNRMNAAEPGKLLRGCTCVAVPFAGGMCEVQHFTSNIVLVNDLDRHVMNLCNIVRERRADLVAWLDGTPYHPDQLEQSQNYCLSKDCDMRAGIGITSDECDLFDWACHYFVSSWMTRGGKGGTKGEFDAGLSVRWKSGGGDSVVRFRSATEALTEWEKVMRRCTFTTLDAMEFLAECKKRDIPKNGIYCDPPWIDDGDTYTHNIDPVALRDALLSFEHTRIVVRYGDCEQVRDMYQESDWIWHRLESRTQANAAKAEVLLERKR